MEHQHRSEILQTRVKTAEKWREIFGLPQTSTGLIPIFRPLSEGLFNSFFKDFPKKWGFP
jgi:hypothetical protein